MLTIAEIKMKREDFIKKYSEKKYLGDGLYVKFDSGYFILKSEHGNSWNSVALATPVFDNLIRHRNQVYEDAENITGDNKKYPILAKENEWREFTNLIEGGALFKIPMPQTLSAESLEDLENWIDRIFKKIRRIVANKENYYQARLTIGLEDNNSRIEKIEENK